MASAASQMNARSHLIVQSVRGMPLMRITSSGLAERIRSAYKVHTPLFGVYVWLWL